jgi:hypothetical protein
MNSMAVSGDFWKGAAVNVFKITPEVFQGAFPDDAAAKYLRQCGVSAILNVSGGTLDSAAGFESLAVPFPDGFPIPKDAIERSLLFMGKSIKAGKKVFVHCSAGQNRSPTIVWLYLIFAGMTEEQAMKVFEGKTLDAVPGHPKLVVVAKIEYAKSLRTAT